jgi:hypothetical protein
MYRYTAVIVSWLGCIKASKKAWTISENPRLIILSRHPSANGLNANDTK